MEQDLLIARGLKHIWHPCSQMKDYETFKPLAVKRAKGPYFYLEDGSKIIDAISSWWCKSLGHQHPRLKKALKRQLDCFEHVPLVNLTNRTIVALSEKLSRLLPPLDKAFYAGDGSCAVEIALKMSLHARKIEGNDNRRLFLSLENSYHGETIGALSISDMGIYRNAYTPMLFNTQFITALPYVHTTADPLWQDCSHEWEAIKKQLEPFKDTATAIIIEPIVQGAGGMKIYSQDFLKRLAAWARNNHVHLIADEIMTGIGRTGKMLACQHAGIIPDFLCLSKGLTSGWLPFSVVLTSSSIYDLFYDNYESGKSFLHSHTYSGNVLAASVALEVLKIMEEENLCERVESLQKEMYECMLEVATHTHRLTAVRGIGGMVAADLNCSPSQRLGFEVYKKAMSLGAFLRPLGNTLYWMPPFTLSERALRRLRDITIKSICAVASI